MKGKCPKKKCLKGKCLKEKCPKGKCPKESVIRKVSVGKVSGGTNPEGTCPNGDCLKGKCLMLTSPNSMNLNDFLDRILIFRIVWTCSWCTKTFFSFFFSLAFCTALLQLRPKEHVLDSGQAKKKSSPYVVFKQRNLHEMHNLVLELDNNLSFGSNDHQENTTASTHNGVKKGLKILHLTHFSVSLKKFNFEISLNF